MESFDQSLKCLLQHEPAEGVSVQALRNYLPKERLMASTLYQEILAEGAVKTKKETLLQVLTYRLGEVEPTVRERIQSLDSGEVLTSWHEEALQAISAEAAQKLVEKIKKALRP